MTVLRTIATALLALGLSACSALQEQAAEPEPDVTLETVLKEGRQYSLAEAQARFDDARYEAAATALGNILRREPENRHAALLMGETLLKLGRPKHSVGYFSAAKEDPSLRPEALQGMGIAYLLIDDRLAARDRLEEAVGLRPGLWRAHNALGQIHDSEHEWAAAGAAYEKALAARPDAAIVHNNMGMSAMLQQDFDTAIAHLQQAVALDPSLDRAQTNLRIAFALEGAYLDAFAGVERDRMADTLNNIGYAAMMRGDYEVAESYFVRAIESSPTYHDKAATNLERVRFLRETGRMPPVS